MDKVKDAIAQVFEEMAAGLTSGSYAKRIRVGLTMAGSEHGEAEMLRGAELAKNADPSLDIVVFGQLADTELTFIETDCMKTAHDRMDEMLLAGELDAAVTMHYNFPIGVSTVGRVVTPALGRKLYIASTTGTADTERTSAMLKNAIGAIAVAKACGNEAPAVGILNIDGGRQLERALTKLQENGYPIKLAQSGRADGGSMMRGNDLLQGVPDIMVMDSLTGNVMVKLLSAYMTGGSYEAIGDGYGPGVGEGYGRIVNIISRASGAPVVAGAIRFAGACAKGGLLQKADAEFASARKAGLDALLSGFYETAQGEKSASEPVPEPPPVKVVTEEIPGIEILELEDAVHVVWKKGIYATSGMGCTGPIILVAPEDKEAALIVLKEAGYL